MKASNATGSAPQKSKTPNRKDMMGLVAKIKGEKAFNDRMDNIDKDHKGDVIVTGAIEAYEYVQRVCMDTIRGQKTDFPKIRAQAFEIARKWSLNKTQKDFIMAFIRHSQIDRKDSKDVKGPAAKYVQSSDKSESTEEAKVQGKYNTSKALRRIEQYSIFCMDNFQLFNTTMTQAEIKQVKTQGAGFFRVCYNPSEKNPLVMLMDFPDNEMVEKLTGCKDRVKRNFVRNGFLMQHRLMYLHEAQTDGTVFLADYKKLSFGNMMKMQKWMPKDLDEANKKMFKGIFPVRLVKFCLRNEPWWLRWLMAFIKPFMSSKIRNRIQFLGTDAKKVHKEILPPNLLLKEHGGQLDEIDNFLYHDEFLRCEPSPLDGWPCSPLFVAKAKVVDKVKDDKKS